MNWQWILDELKGVPYGERRRKVEKIARMVGVHPATIYRKLQKMNGKARKIPRTKHIPEDWIDLVARVKREGMSKGQTPRELSTEQCIRILEARGMLPPGVLKASTVNRRLLERGFRQRKAVVRYEAEYANQVFQMDFSRSEYFGVVDYDPHREDYIIMTDEPTLHYKNKQSKKLRLWAVGLVDEYSRLALVRYFVAANENSLMGLEFLYWVWSRPEDGHPLRYVPEYLRTDNGSFAKSSYTQTMFNALGIQWLPTTVGNKKALGKKERQWRTLWQRYELQTVVLLGSKTTLYLSDLNAMALDWMLEDMQQPHHVHGGTREAAYRRSILEHPPRSVDVDVVRLACRVEERTVRMDATISLDGEVWQVPEEYVGRRIRVYRSITGEVVGEYLESSERFVCTPFQPKPFGEYKRYADTYGERMEKAGLPFEPEGYQPVSARKPDAKQAFLPPREQAVQPQSPFLEQPATHFADVNQARSYIGRMLGVPYPQVAHLFDEVLEQTLDVSAIRAVVQAVREAM